MTDADDDARKQFQRAAWWCAANARRCCQRTLRDGRELARDLASSQPSHDSSCSAERVPPTVRRKISSSVSFLAGAS